MTTTARIEHTGGAALTEIVGGIGPTDLSIVLADATGWPTGATGVFYAVINDGEATVEKIKITSRSGTTLTIASTDDRGEDGTSAQSHANGSAIHHCFTALEADQASAHTSASSGVHGVAGSVVGTTDAQTLSNKTISGASNTLSNIPQAAVTGLGTIASDLDAAEVDIDDLETLTTGHGTRLTTAESNITAHGSRLTDLETENVPRFASTGARDTAIPSPVAGMVCAVGNTLYVYSSSAWREIARRNQVLYRAASGSFAIGTISSGGSIGPVNTEFPITFDFAPLVFMSYHSGRITAGLGTITTTSFDATFNNWSPATSNEGSIRWFALQMTSAGHSGGF